MYRKSRNHLHFNKSLGLPFLGVAATNDQKDGFLGFEIGDAQKVADAEKWCKSFDLESTIRICLSSNTAKYVQKRFSVESL